MYFILMKIALGMITKNSYPELGDVFRRVLLRAVSEIPFDSAILCDDSDVDDSTCEVFFNIIKQFHLSKIIILVGGGRRSTRATARQKVVDHFLKETDCEWLFFLDDDALLNRGFFKEARIYLEDERVGLVWGLNYDATVERRTYLERLGINYEKYLIEQFWKRGGCHDVFLRREAIEDLKIPPILHVYEDYWILRHVLKKGYNVRIVKTGIVHVNPGRPISPSLLMYMARLAKSLGIERASVKSFLKTCIGGLPLNLWTGVKAGMGLKRGFIRWRDKTLFRLFLLLTDHSRVDRLLKGLYSEGHTFPS